MQEDTTPRICASIDWITLTCHDPEKRRGLWHLAAGLMRDPSQAECDERIWRWKGYTGQHRGNVTWGVRDDGTIMQLSQDLANRTFGAAMTVADNVTRLDLAVTVWGGSDFGNPAQRHTQEVIEWKAAHGRRITVGGVQNEGILRTLYLGDRSSDAFGRVYDKHLESSLDAYAGAWRYEVELKGEKAERTSRALYSATDRPDWIRRAVFQWFGRRGCILPDGCLDEPLYICTIRPTTDDSSRLAWLATDVRPAVQRLLQHGHANAVWEALGIPRSVSERYRLREQIDPNNHHHDDLSGDDGS